MPATKKYWFTMDYLELNHTKAYVEAASATEAEALMREGKFTAPEVPFVDEFHDMCERSFNYDSDKPVAYMYYLEPPELIRVEHCSREELCR